VSTRLTPQQSQRRLDILDTVRDQLSRTGYEGLSMREVAAGAGVSPTTLYNIFENKDGLILAALQDQLTRIGTEVAAANTTGLESYRTRAEIVADQIVATPEYARAMAHMLFNADAIDPIALILLRDQLAAQEALLVEMRAGREIRSDIDPETWARVIVGNSWSIILLWLKGHCQLATFADEYVRAQLLTLVPIMTPDLARKFRGLVDAA
jgi:AcrR family transcriptional regulator